MASKSLYRLPQEDLDGLIARSKDDLSALSSAHLLLTGCTSFFGKWLIETLLYANEQLTLNLNLTVLSRSPELFFASMPHFKRHPALTTLKGDMLTADFEKIPFTHIIHGANLPFDGTLDWPLRHMETATLGTRRLVDAAVKNRCHGLLYLSSGAAYRAEASSGVAFSTTPVLREAQNYQTENLSEPSVYSITKKFMEVYAAGMGQAYSIHMPLARCFSFAGPYMPLAGPQALGNFLADGLAGRDIVIKGDGTAIRSYMYGADLVAWLLAILLRGRSGVPYNVGSGESVSIRETAEAVRLAFPEKKLQVRVLGKASSGNAPSVYVPDTQRCKNELGLYRSRDLGAICLNTVKWLTQNEDLLSR